MSAPSTVHRELAEAWNNRDFARLRDLLHPQYTYTSGDGKESAGPEAAIEIARMYARAFPDGVLEVRRVYTNRNIAIAEMVAHGTHNGELMGVAATGRPAEILICNVIEIREGKVYREREYFDALHLMAQLGAVSVPGKAASA